MQTGHFLVAVPAEVGDDLAHLLDLMTLHVHALQLVELAVHPGSRAARAWTSRGSRGGGSGRAGLSNGMGELSIVLSMLCSSVCLNSAFFCAISMLLSLLR